MMKALLIICGFFVVTSARKGFGPTEQEWGYVDIRNGAHMFWWLHYTTASPKPTQKPLIIWLQGGPGGSSTQYGNFEEIGPIDANLKPRNTSWTQYANVLFVDNPVGTGFSYVDNDEFATTNKQIAEDFVVFLREFYKTLPQFEDTPLYIFTESYGGKMTVEIALHIYQAMQSKTLNANFKGVGLGDSWISPVDSCLTWAPYLYSLGFLDTSQYQKLVKKANKVKDLVKHEKWLEAEAAWGTLEGSIASFTENVDFYNVLTYIEEFRLNKNHNPKTRRNSLKSIAGDSLMDKVKASLNLTSEFGEQNAEVFSALNGDFMKPVTDIVERLLNETDITVAVYNGNLDLIVDTLGTVQWLDRLQFKNNEKWENGARESFGVNGFIEGYEKRAGNLIFYWVLRSGHMVPKDNPNAMLYILKQVTHDFKV